MGNLILKIFQQIKRFIVYFSHFFVKFFFYGWTLMMVLFAIHCFLSDEKPISHEFPILYSHFGEKYREEINKDVDSIPKSILTNSTRKDFKEFYMTYITEKKFNGKNVEKRFTKVVLDYMWILVDFEHPADEAFGKLYPPHPDIFKQKIEEVIKKDVDTTEEVIKKDSDTIGKLL
jgi:hypothetical protein